MKPPKVTRQWVRLELDLIRNEARDDDESAHSHEDELHQMVLRAIAEGWCDDPQICAKAALESLEIEFARWCA